MRPGKTIRQMVAGKAVSAFRALDRKHQTLILEDLARIRDVDPDCFEGPLKDALLYSPAFRSVMWFRIR